MIKCENPWCCASGTGCAAVPMTRHGGTLRVNVGMALCANGMLLAHWHVSARIPLLVFHRKIVPECFIASNTFKNSPNVNILQNLA